MHKLSIDSSQVSHLPLCECGWRGSPHRSKEDAWIEARNHESRSHIGQIQALDALLAYRRRTRRRTGPGRQRS